MPGWPPSAWARLRPRSRPQGSSGEVSDNSGLSNVHRYPVTPDRCLADETACDLLRPFALPALRAVSRTVAATGSALLQKWTRPFSRARNDCRLRRLPAAIDTTTITLRGQYTLHEEIGNLEIFRDWKPVGGRILVIGLRCLKQGCRSPASCFEKGSSSGSFHS
jgi:hypothetical protein